MDRQYEKKETRTSCSEDWGKRVSALVDNELEPSEALKVKEHLAHCDVCLDFANKLRKLKGITDDMKLVDLPDVKWKKYWTGIYNRIERSIGWIFISIGLVLLVLFSVYEFFKDFFLNSEITLIVRSGVAFLIIGFIILIVSVGREAFFRFRNERYKEVDR